MIARIYILLQTIILFMIFSFFVSSGENKRKLGNVKRQNERETLKDIDGNKKEKNTEKDKTRDRNRSKKRD